ncbi:MAG: glutamate synthase, partial [Myxococcales bacterium]|nr:glutamate synthase [Myxococcales bacterium]
MGNPSGFISLRRKKAPKRPVEERVKDYQEVEGNFSDDELRDQAARCMDCGVPFCHKGCPLGNDIPEWNDRLYHDRWHQAIDRLHATNNFPEFTGRTCPAPCEESCVLNLHDEPVTIRMIEKQLVDNAWDEGWVKPLPPKAKTGRKVAIVGSGPAGMAAAQQLARIGHDV